MKMLTLLLTALLLVSAAVAGPVESFTVNGLKVILAPNTVNDILAVNMYFRGDGASGDLNKAGLDQLTFAVAVEATKAYPKAKLSETIEKMDTRIGSRGGRDYSSISMQCVKSNFPKSWDVFADAILNPTFDSVDVVLERERQLAGIKQGKDDPDTYLNKLSMDVFYADHPYLVDPMGTERTVAGFTSADLRKHMDRRRVAQNMLLVVVGNMTRAELEKAVTKAFGKLPQGAVIPVENRIVRHPAPSLRVVKREIPTNYIRGSFSIPPFGSTEAYAMGIAISILQDRVFEEVRTKRSLSYAPAASAFGLFSNAGYIYVTAVNPDTTISVMLAELKKLQDEPVNAKTLNDKRNGYVTRYYYGMETNASQAETFARYELVGVGYEQAQKFLDNIKAVTPERIQAAAKEYMHNLQFVLLGNPASVQTARFMF
jgi:predicted Zn-dependent peptidase